MNIIQYQFYKLMNPLFYKLRQFFSIYKKEMRFQNNHTTFQFSNIEIERKSSKLVRQFNFQFYNHYLNDLDYRLNLYHLDLLSFVDSQIDIQFPNLIKAIDIGSKNFYYAPSLYHFYFNQSKIHSFEGIELDAFRRYQDLHTRFDYANAYTKHLKNTSFLPMDFLSYHKNANIITMFLPFVFKEPLLFWGLPMSEYNPKKMMAHAYHLLESPGIWVITNQGEIEKKKQHQLLNELRISYNDLGKFVSPYFETKNERFITIVKK